jgi:PAS domain-containing protein
MRIPSDELLRSDPVQWIHADDRAMVLELRMKLREKRETLDHYEARHIGRVGVVRWLNIRPKSMAWAGGMATLPFFSEITERKAKLEALLSSEERYRAVIEHSCEGMFVVKKGKFVFANACDTRACGTVTRSTGHRCSQRGDYVRPRYLRLR